jgi:drug/metabolite transporter (DMT)-like permease
MAGPIIHPKTVGACQPSLAIAKSAFDRDASEQRRGWALLIGSILLSSVAQVLMKAGAVSGGLSTGGTDGPLGLFFEPLVMLGLVVYAMGTVLWIRCLRQLELSLAYLVSALQYILVFVAAKWIFAESLSATRLLGLAIILVGIVTVTRRGARRA